MRFQSNNEFRYGEIALPRHFNQHTNLYTSHRSRKWKYMDTPLIICLIHSQTATYNNAELGTDIPACKTYGLLRYSRGWILATTSSFFCLFKGMRRSRQVSNGSAKVCDKLSFIWILSINHLFSLACQNMKKVDRTDRTSIVKSGFLKKLRNILGKISDKQTRRSKVRHL